MRNDVATVELALVNNGVACSGRVQGIPRELLDLCQLLHDPKLFARLESPTNLYFKIFEEIAVNE